MQILKGDSGYLYFQVLIIFRIIQIGAYTQIPVISPIWVTRKKGTEIVVWRLSAAKIALHYWKQTA